MTTAPGRPRRAEDAVARMERDLAHARARPAVRRFSQEPVPQAAIEAAIEIAGTAPAGVRPWTFVPVADPVIQARIRAAASQASGGVDAPDDPSLAEAPWLVVVFRRDWELHEGRRRANHFASESVGLAVGMAVAALQRAGLAVLVRIPPPAIALRDVCGRPDNERSCVILAVGWPAP